MLIRHLIFAGVLAVSLAIPVHAQTAAATPAAGSLAADLLKDITDLEGKMMGLARAIPADKYAWRPGTGVRSVGEVLQHVAADNYLLPALLGHAADPATGIKGDDYKTVQAFETRTIGRDENLAQLERSFAHVKRALSGTAQAKMADKVSLFGQPATAQYTWILTATHLHEHLGQLIAYARSNGITPPWSK